MSLFENHCHLYVPYPNERALVEVPATIERANILGIDGSRGYGVRIRVNKYLHCYGGEFSINFPVFYSKGKDDVKRDLNILISDDYYLIEIEKKRYLLQIKDNK